MFLGFVAQRDPVIIVAVGRVGTALRWPDYVRQDAAVPYRTLSGTMVGVAQLVEPWIVIPVVVGSNPITHPRYWVISSVGRAGDS